MRGVDINALRGLAPPSLPPFPGHQAPRPARRSPAGAAGTGVEAGQAPVVLADHSDRSGYATWVLARSHHPAGPGKDSLIVTVADWRAIEVLKDGGVKAGDSFNMEAGGLADESPGDPARVTGTVLNVTGGASPRAGDAGGQIWVRVKFGRDTVLVISPYLVQVMELSTITALGLDSAAFDASASV